MPWQMGKIEAATGDVYGPLWVGYSDELFNESVAMFEKRWRANGEPADYFKEKCCLDAGCGGGRYSMAMARMGAARVVGVDVAGTGLADARSRCDRLGIANVRFQAVSVLALPFPDGEFDFVCCGGVLHYTVGIERGLREIRRVLKPGGGMYLLLYGSGGIFWPMNALVRPFARVLGSVEMERCVPALETYTEERVDALLGRAGFSRWRYWRTGRNDRESDARAMLGELELRAAMWRESAFTAADPVRRATVARACSLWQSLLPIARNLVTMYEAGLLSESQLDSILIGNGHHRLIAEVS